MKLAILADIHGNADALAPTLRAARRKGAERLIILGDIIGYYYAATEVIRLLREWPFETVKGNHERLLSSTLADQSAAGRYRERYGSALDVLKETTTASDIEWLISLPDRATFTAGSLLIELCHGSPGDPDAYVYPDAPAALLAACRLADRDLVLMGHTHYPMIATSPSCTLLNPGSVGQARDRGGEACWCLLDTETHVFVFERTSYDPAPTIESARRRDPHLPYLADVLIRR